MIFFCLGSVLAVTCSDAYAPKRVNRFVGICIERDQRGLMHTFLLRNVIDGIGTIFLAVSLGFCLMYFYFSRRSAVRHVQSVDSIDTSSAFGEKTRSAFALFTRRFVGIFDVSFRHAGRIVAAWNASTYEHDEGKKILSF